jgi:hypothetical protein
LKGIENTKESNYVNRNLLLILLCENEYEIRSCEFSSINFWNSILKTLMDRYDRAPDPNEALAEVKATMDSHFGLLVSLMSVITQMAQEENKEA